MTASNTKKTEIEDSRLVSTGSFRQKPMFEETSVDESDLQRINKLAPGELKPEQVFVRSMLLCSSQPCPSDGCQFTRNALDRIAERIVGLSVLTGHDRTALPLARFYKARVVESGGDGGEPVYFVRAWFYWLRETSGAKDLLLNIDGGIYREVSLAWRYDSWRCSICGSSNGQCGHRVGATYNGKICYRQIDRITDVLEGSLVYKAADKNTYLMGARFDVEDGEEDWDDLDEDEPILVIGERGDRLIEILEKGGAIQYRGPLSEVRESLSHGVSSLWVLDGDEEFVRRMADTFLAENGVCCGDIRSDSLTVKSIHFRRAKDSSIELVHTTQLKEDPDAVRTL